MCFHMRAYTRSRSRCPASLPERVGIVWKVGRRTTRKLVDPIPAATADVSLASKGDSVPKLGDQNRTPSRTLKSLRHAPDSHSELARTVAERGQLRNKRSYFALRRECVVVAPPLHTFARFR
jgi:hypothetical protein